MMAGDPIVGLGVIGDSYSDEYSDQNLSEGKSWVQILSSARAVPVGATGNWGEPRRNGFEFNWARAGATSTLVDSQGQTSGVVGQIADGDVSHVVVMVGHEDFGITSPAYSGIFQGTWTTAQIDQYVENVTSNIYSVLSDLAIGQVSTILVNLFDDSLSPAAKAITSNATLRERVSAVVDRVNLNLRDLANSHHVPFLDLHGLAEELLGDNPTPIASWDVGGVTISNTAGAAASNSFISNRVNPHTALQAVFANLVITGLNLGYDSAIPILSEADIASIAGINYQSDTMDLVYSDYVFLPQLPFHLDYGDATPDNDFTARVAEWATDRVITIPNAAEIANLKANIETGLAKYFQGTTVEFLTEAPLAGNFETVHFGIATADAPGAAADDLGLADWDWRNTDESGIGYVFPQNFNSSAFNGLSRSQQLSLLANALTFFAAHQVGLQLGLQSSDAYGDPHITSLNYDNTAGWQFADPMSADNHLGFNFSRLTSLSNSRFSKLSRAKLAYANFVNRTTLSSEPEIGSAHFNSTTAMPLDFHDLTARGLFGLHTSNVESATLSQPQERDWYKLSGNAGDLLTVQVLATDLYSGSNDFDAKLRIISAAGAELIAVDNTILGDNSIGIPATGRFVDLDPTLVHFRLPTTGTYFVEVTAPTADTYDLFVARQDISVHPWQNPRLAADVDDNGLVAPLDAILVINELNNPTFADSRGFLPVPPKYPIAPAPYLDVSGDDRVLPLDAILVINVLNARPSGGEGESARIESAPSDAFDHVFRSYAENFDSPLRPGVVNEHPTAGGWDWLAEFVSGWQESMAWRRKRQVV